MRWVLVAYKSIANMCEECRILAKCMDKYGSASWASWMEFQISDLCCKIEALSFSFFNWFSFISSFGTSHCLLALFVGDLGFHRFAATYDIPAYVAGFFQVEIWHLLGSDICGWSKYLQQHPSLTGTDIDHEGGVPWTPFLKGTTVECHCKPAT